MIIKNVLQSIRLLTDGGNILPCAEISDPRSDVLIRSTLIHEELRSWDPGEREAYQCAVKRVVDAGDDSEQSSWI